MARGGRKICAVVLLLLSGWAAGEKKHERHERVITKPSRRGIGRPPLPYCCRKRRAKRKRGNAAGVSCAPRPPLCAGGESESATNGFVDLCARPWPCATFHAAVFFTTISRFFLLLLLLLSPTLHSSLRAPFRSAVPARDLRSPGVRPDQRAVVLAARHRTVRRDPAVRRVRGVLGPHALEEAVAVRAARAEAAFAGREAARGDAGDVRRGLGSSVRRVVLLGLEWFEV